MRAALKRQAIRIKDLGVRCIQKFVSLPYQSVDKRSHLRQYLQPNTQLEAFLMRVYSRKFTWSVSVDTTLDTKEHLDGFIYILIEI